jgi:4-oxalocrotonate tautomerase
VNVGLSLSTKASADCNGPPAGAAFIRALTFLRRQCFIPSRYGATKLPIVRIELSPGRTHEQKARYVEEVTRITSAVLQCPVESVDVMFIEVEGKNWAHAGKFYSSPKT